MCWHFHNYNRSRTNNFPVKRESNYWQKSSEWEKSERILEIGCVAAIRCAPRHGMRKLLKWRARDGGVGGGGAERRPGRIFSAALPPHRFSFRRIGAPAADSSGRSAEQSTDSQ